MTNETDPVRRPKPRWEYAIGEKGHRVVVYERETGGMLYVRLYDRTLRGGEGDMLRLSLGHRDKKLAMRYGVAQHAKLLDGEAALLTGRVTLARLLTRYIEERTPRKRSAQEREQDRRRAELWTRWLGADSDPHKLTLGQWEAFIDARAAGTINSRGEPVPPEKRRPVRARTVEADAKWLKWMLTWGTRWREAAGYLLRENVARGFTVPSEKNPRRPLATADRYEALRAVSDRVLMELRPGGRRVPQRSVYQQADAATMLRVVLEAGELREVR